MEFIIIWLHITIVALLVEPGPKDTDQPAASTLLAECTRECEEK